MSVSEPHSFCLTCHRLEHAREPVHGLSTHSHYTVFTPKCLRRQLSHMLSLLRPEQVFPSTAPAAGEPEGGDPAFATPLAKGIWDSQLDLIEA